MVGPQDGAKIPTKSSKIKCWGATLKPNELVEVKVYGVAAGWETVGEAYTGTRPIEAHGIEWYVWACEIEVPDGIIEGGWPYWRTDEHGEEYALVTANYAGSYQKLYTFDSWEWSPDESIRDFYETHGDFDDPDWVGHRVVKVYVDP